MVTRPAAGIAVVLVLVCLLLTSCAGSGAQESRPDGAPTRCITYAGGQRSCSVVFVKDVNYQPACRQHGNSFSCQQVLVASSSSGVRG